jgi:hypothetical protein
MARSPLRTSLLAGLLGPLLAWGCAGTPPAQPFTAELEGAALWQSRNDVAVPGDTGTRFSLREVVGSGPFLGGRAYVGWRPRERHELRALMAPLSISGSGALGQAVSFAGADFVPGPARAEYRFDSYRLTYRYLLHDGGRVDWHVGLTGKLRDAEIRLSQDGQSARKTDTGFVPLLHVATDFSLSPLWRLSLDADAAWAPAGRAVDLALKSYWTLRPGFELGFGYRTIEGGADNDEVYTFSWIHQLVASLRGSF